MNPVCMVVGLPIRDAPEALTKAIAEELKGLDKWARPVYKDIFRGLIDAHETSTSVSFEVWRGHKSPGPFRCQVYAMAEFACRFLGWSASLLERNPTKASWLVRDVGRPNQ